MAAVQPQFLAAAAPTNGASMAPMNNGSLGGDAKMGKNMNLGANKSNNTFQVINNLLLSKAQAQRVFHIGLGSVSIAMALIIIMRIYYDSWRASQLKVRLRPRKFSWLREINAAERFPLILGYTIILQQVIFVGVQGFALDKFWAKKCDRSVQIVLPALFQTGFIHLVFGFETTLRSLQKSRFSSKKRWATGLCLGIVSLFSIAMWIITKALRSKKRCFGDLIWRPVLYSPIVISIYALLTLVFILMALIIGLRLRTTVNIEPIERIAASKIVYFLIWSVLINAFIVPFYIQVQLSNLDNNLTSSRVAEFVLFSSGFIFAFLDLFLRANAARLAIKPTEAPWQARRRLRFFGPNDMEILNISRPIPIDTRPNEYWGDEKKIPINTWESQAAWEKSLEAQFGAAEKVRYAGKTSPAQNNKPLFNMDWTLSPKTPSPAGKWPLPADPLPTPVAAKTQMTSPVASQPAFNTHKRGAPSYSLFPIGENASVRAPPAAFSPQGTSQPKVIQPNNFPPITTVFSNNRGRAPSVVPSITDVHSESLTLQDPLQPPNPLFTDQHQRSNSTTSSATVQIGLRLSSFPASIAAPRIEKRLYDPSQQSPLLPRIDTDSSGESLGFPIQFAPANSQSITTPQRKPAPSTVKGADGDDSDYESEMAGKGFTNPFADPKKKQTANSSFKRNSDPNKDLPEPPKAENNTSKHVRQNSKFKKYESQFQQNPFSPTQVMPAVPALQRSNTAETLSAKVYTPPSRSANASPVTLSDKVYTPTGQSASENGIGVARTSSLKKSPASPGKDWI